MHVVHQQKDVDFELKEELMQFDQEEFKMTHCLRQISELNLVSFQRSSESKGDAAKVFNAPLKDLIGEELFGPHDENFVFLGLQRQ